MSLNDDPKRLPRMTPDQGERDARIEAMNRLMREDQKGLESAGKGGWISEAEILRLLESD